MDLTYMNASREDLGVLHDYKFDLAFGKDENDFELQIPAASHCCDGGYFVYIEGTEYGGMIDAIRSDTGAQEVVYSGRSWHGIMNSKVIVPDEGTDYLTVSGEANTVISTLITRLGLSELFQASSADSGLIIAGYQMPRYVAAYDGLRGMLQTVGGCLQFTFTNGMVELAALTAGDYTADNELDSDLLPFTATKHFNPINHLICLGKGELAARQVLHLYVDAAGQISDTQTIFGINERIAVYDVPAVESLAELRQRGVEYLEHLKQPDNLEASLSVEDDRFSVQDLVGATDHVTGLTATAEVTKKIVTIEDGQITISYHC